MTKRSTHAMLSLEDCRSILGPDTQLSDKNLELLRAQLYGLADVAIAVFLASRYGDSACDPSEVPEVD